MRIPADTTLIEAARRIAPVIREHSEEAERERGLSHLPPDRHCRVQSAAAPARGGAARD